MVPLYIYRFHEFNVLQNYFKRYCQKQTKLNIWGAVRKKNNIFFARKIFFWCSIILFLSTWNTFLKKIYFFCWYESFLSIPEYFLCNIILFVSTQNYFSCNTKFLFWTSFRMLCHGDIFLLSHSNKNIITCQKINCHFYAFQKN